MSCDLSASLVLNIQHASRVSSHHPKLPITQVCSGAGLQYVVNYNVLRLFKCCVRQALR